MMYAYKINIKYEPQIIKYIRDVELKGGLLSLTDISKHLKPNENFSFSEIEDGFDFITIMNIQGERLETEGELKLRINKQEKYNIGYDAHHLKYKKK